MARPKISIWFGQLFRVQLNVVLDWLEANGGGGGGTATWGSIGGILSGQADLQGALDGKATVVHAHVAADVTDFDAASDARVSAGVTTHEALSDPHPQYLTGTEGDAAYVSLAGDTMTGPLVTIAPATAAGFMLTPGAADPSAPTDGEIWRRTSDMRARIGGTSYSFGFLNGASTFTGKKTFSPSTTGGALLNIAPGVAPSAPVDGDIWVDAAGVWARVNGVTVQLG